MPGTRYKMPPKSGFHGMHEGGNLLPWNAETLSQTWSQFATIGHGQGHGKVPGKEFKFCQIHFIIENLR